MSQWAWPILCVRMFTAVGGHGAMVERKRILYGPSSVFFKSEPIYLLYDLFCSYSTRTCKSVRKNRSCVNIKQWQLNTWALIFTCSGLKRCAKRAVAHAIGSFHRKIVNVTTFQALNDAGWNSAVAVKCVSTHRLSAAKIFHSTLADLPRQDGSVGLTVKIHWKTGGLTGHCEGRDRRVSHRELACTSHSWTQE